MLSSLTAAWRNLVKRLAADWLIMTAAFVTIVLAGVLLASGPIYANAVTLSALQRTLVDAEVPTANLSISQRTPPDLYQVADATVEASVAAAFGSVGAEVIEVLTSESFELPGDADGEVIDLAEFQSLERIEEHASLDAGSWPSSSLEAAIPTQSAERLGLDTGDTVLVTSRRDQSVEHTIEIVGTFDISDPAAAYWLGHPLAQTGVTGEGSFITHGPFVVTQETMVDELTSARLNSDWRVLPRFENLSASEAGRLRGRVASLGDQLNIAFRAASENDARASEFTVATGLDNLLAATQRSLRVTGSSVLALLVQLAILAGYALVLTAGLLVETRRTETNLLRSRGASPGQILTLALMEGLLLTVPAAIIAPGLAAWGLGLLNDVGPLASVGLTLRPEPTVEAYLLAGLAGAGSIFALAWPAYRSARSFSGSTRKNRRQRSSSAGQRAGVDIALLVLAGMAFWQLQSLGPEITARVRGRFGVDPLLVVAPALGLLAGAVLALRMIPLLARLAERVAAGGRATVSALSAWQVARRPVRYARSALLLIMAIGIGFFASSYSTTWVTSQRDQAAHQVGADIRLSPSMRVGDSVPDLHLGAAHEMLSGVIASMPVVRKTAQLARSATLGRFAILDASEADSVIEMRPDLAPDFSSLMGQLLDGRPGMAGFDLPGRPTEIGVIISAREEQLLDPEGNPVFPLSEFNPRVSVVLQDADDLLHRVDLGALAVNRGPTMVDGDLILERAGESLTAAYPLKLVDVEILSPSPVNSNAREATLHFFGVFTRSDGEPWSRLDVAIDAATWAVTAVAPTSPGFSPFITYADRQIPNSLTVSLSTGASFGPTRVPVYFSLRPRGTELPATYPIVVSETFLESNAAPIGSILNLPALGIEGARAQIIGTVSSFPTVPPGSGEAVLMDLPTFHMLTYRTGSTIEPASEYWLAVEDGEEKGLAEALQSDLFESVTVTSRTARAESLSSDPVALGTIGALALGFVAAAVFAAVGFAVSAAVSARERVTEFALLRALGLSPRQLGSWLSIEQGVLVFLSLLLGTAIGALLTAVILPQVTLTQQGARAVPEVTVIFPWTTVFALELAVLAVLGVIVIIMTALLRRLGLGSLLRMGED